MKLCQLNSEKKYLNFPNHFTATSGKLDMASNYTEPGLINYSTAEGSGFDTIPVEMPIVFLKSPRVTLPAA